MLAAGCSRNTECVGYGKAGLSHSDEVGRLCSKGDAGDIGGGVKWYDFDYVHSPEFLCYCRQRSRKAVRRALI